MVARSFSSDMPMGPALRPLRNCSTTGSSLVSSTSRGPKATNSRQNSIPMLSGTVVAMSMLWVTISMVASSWVLMSMSSCERYEVRTGSRPESGSSQRMICGSRTSARASPARLCIPPEISPGSFRSAPARPTTSMRSMTIRRISDSFLRVCSRSGKAMLSKRLIEPKSAPSWKSSPKSLRAS